MGCESCRERYSRSIQTVDTNREKPHLPIHKMLHKDDLPTANTTLDLLTHTSSLKIINRLIFSPHLAILDKFSQTPNQSYKRTIYSLSTQSENFLTLHKKLKIEDISTAKKNHTPTTPTLPITPDPSVESLQRQNTHCLNYQ